MISLAKPSLTDEYLTSPRLATEESRIPEYDCFFAILDSSFKKMNASSLNPITILQITSVKESVIASHNKAALDLGRPACSALETEVDFKFFITANVIWFCSVFTGYYNISKGHTITPSCGLFVLLEIFLLFQY
jgi:hypothetical protein